MTRRKSAMFVTVLFSTWLFVCVTCTNAYALDRRLGLMFKTAGWGAAAGAVVGAGTSAMGLGGIRNVFMGASAGMYAGILLAAYIVATPSEPGPKKAIHNPYPKKRPVGPNDWQYEDEEEYDDILPPEQKDQSSTRGLELRWAVTDTQRERMRVIPRETGVWTQLVSLEF
jgi:hypothetical protein